jgi:hypothetical protein
MAGIVVGDVVAEVVVGDVVAGVVVGDVGESAPGPVAVRASSAPVAVRASSAPVTLVALASGGSGLGCGGPDHRTESKNVCVSASRPTEHRSEHRSVRRCAGSVPRTGAAVRTERERYPWQI